MTKKLRRILSYIPIPSLVIFVFGIITGILHILLINNADLADIFNDTVSQGTRFILAKLTGWFSFSLVETLIISSPVLVVCLYLFCMRKASRGRKHFVRVIVGLLSVIVLLYIMFMLIFGAGYRTNTIDKKLGIERQKVSGDELAATMEIVVDNLNDLCNDVLIAVDYGSVKPYSYSDATELALESYDRLHEKYPFIHNFNSTVKQIVLSPIMTYTHISGVYTYFTGEANLNTNYPDFVNVYSLCHEMAHQRGIAREDEANFIAYLVCIGSDDEFMRYCGYLNMCEYLMTPLHSANPEKYRELMSKLDIRVRYDLQCYSDFFDKYRENTVAEVSDAVNDTYLKIQGASEGTKSYGMVVDLAVAYHLGGYGD